MISSRSNRIFVMKRTFFNIDRALCRHLPLARKSAMPVGFIRHFGTSTHFYRVHSNVMKQSQSEKREQKKKKKKQTNKTKQNQKKKKRKNQQEK